MKEHLFFIETSMPPVSADLIAEANALKLSFEHLLAETVSYANGIVSEKAIQSNEFVTPFTLSAEEVSSKLTGASLNTNITRAEMELTGSSRYLAADLVKAIMAGNTEEAEAINTRWYANAEEIAVFLGRINPCWSEAEWREMMFTHLGLVADEALTLINKEYQRNIDIYDLIEAQAMEMADTMSEGIIDQFFRRQCRKH